MLESRFYDQYGKISALERGKICMKSGNVWRQQATFQRRAFLSNSVSYYQCLLSFLPCKNTDDFKLLNTMGTNRITKIPPSFTENPQAKSHILTGIPICNHSFQELQRRKCSGAEMGLAPEKHLFELKWGYRYGKWGKNCCMEKGHISSLAKSF